MVNAFYWSEEDKGVVAERLKEGLSARQIAAQFKRSRNAVIGLVHRDATLREIGFARAAHGARKPGRKVTTPRRQSLNPSVVHRPLPRPAAQEGEQNLVGVTMMMLGAQQCKFAVNDAGIGETHLFCGLPAEGSFCAHHHSRVFLRKHLDRET